jgi:hypothetical protein
MLKTPKQQVAFIIFSTMLAAFSLGSIINFTDPYASSWMTFAFFYLSLFLVSVGVLTITGLGLRQAFGPKIYILDLGVSFRQALLISCLITISLFLQAKDLLFWWVEASLILFFIFIEAFFNLKI